MRIKQLKFSGLYILLHLQVANRVALTGPKSYYSFTLITILIWKTPTH